MLLASAPELDRNRLTNKRAALNLTEVELYSDALERLCCIL